MTDQSNITPKPRRSRKPNQVVPAAEVAATTTPEKRLTKKGQVLSLLKREEGATLGELVSATGWLPHTTRAALTGLRKAGHAIDKDKRDDATCYSIKAAA